MEILYLLIGIVLGAVAGYFIALNRTRGGEDESAAQAAAQAREEELAAHAEEMAAAQAAAHAEEIAAAQAAAQAREEELAAHAQALAAHAASEAAATARAEELTNQVKQLGQRQAQENALVERLAPITERLNQLGTQVERMESQRGAQYAALTEQLGNASKATATLTATTGKLETALHSTSARGTWGEVQLKRILELAGMMQNADFTQQATLGTGARPDVVINLPGNRALVIDAKVPLDSFLRYCENPADGAKYLQGHAKALRGHINELKKRDYPSKLGAKGPDAAVDITVLFLPTQALLDSALEADPELLEYAFNQRVAVTTPSSLMALLRSVALVWEGENVTREARDILALGRELTDRLSTVVTHWERVGNGLKSAVKAYNTAIGSVERNLLATARRFEALDTQKLEVAEIDMESAQVRSYTKSELTGEK